MKRYIKSNDIISDIPEIQDDYDKAVNHASWDLTARLLPLISQVHIQTILDICNPADADIRVYEYLCGLRDGGRITRQDANELWSSYFPEG